MKARIIAMIGALLFLSFAAFAQYDYPEVVIPETVKGAADINSTTSALTETFTNQSDLFMNRRNELNMFSSSVSLGTSVIASKHVSVYNIPIGYSFKSKLFFKGNADAYENLSFKAIIPFIQKKFETLELMGVDTLEYKKAGLGDATIKANYNLILNKMFFSLGVYAKLPTGKQKNKVKDRDVPLGTGSTDIDISAFFAKNMGEKLNLHGSFGYEFRGKFKGSDSEFDFGNKMNVLAGGDYLVKMVRVGADISYISTQNTDVVYTGMFPGKSEAPGMKCIDVLPYVKVNVSEKMDAKLYGVIPVSSKWNDIPGFVGTMPDPDRNVRFGFMFTYRLDKAPQE